MASGYFSKPCKQDDFVFIMLFAFVFNLTRYCTNKTISIKVTFYRIFLKLNASQETGGTETTFGRTNPPD